MAETLGYPRWERLEASVPIPVGPHGNTSHLYPLSWDTCLTHQVMNILQFLIQGAMADASAASSGLFSVACWAKEGGMG